MAGLLPDGRSFDFKDTADTLRYCMTSMNPVPTPDPWVNRSEGMRCKSCMWFAPKVPFGDFKIEGVEITSPPYHVGRCRRHAPTMNGFPVVFVNDWCGDHKLNENTL
jgi:hypothetical protein